MQGAARAQVALRHRNPPWPFPALRWPRTALQRRLAPEDPDASLSAFADGDSGLAARRACTFPKRSAGTSFRRVAQTPASAAPSSPRHSRSAHDHNHGRSATAYRIPRSGTFAAQTAPGRGNSGLGLPTMTGYGRVSLGGPWVVPGLLLRLGRADAGRVALRSHCPSTTTRRRFALRLIAPPPCPASPALPACTLNAVLPRFPALCRGSGTAPTGE